MNRVSVPGGWVDFREPEEVPEKLRRRVMILGTQAQGVNERVNEENVDIAENDMLFLFGFNDAVAICLVARWSWEDIPVTVEGLVELPGAVYDAIINYGKTKVTRLIPNQGVDPDPKAPTDS